MGKGGIVVLPFVIIAVAYAVVIPLERVVGGPRRSRRANLAVIVPVLVAGALTDVAIVAAVGRPEGRGTGLLPALGCSGRAAVVVTVVFLDLVAYFGHRWRHAVLPLWALHRAHHTDDDVDVTTLLRLHPLDVVVLNLFVASAVVVLGAPATAVAISGAVGACFGAFTHARVQLGPRVERILGWVVQTPGLHRMHHQPDRPETDSNFGLILTCWDRLFGTLCLAVPRSSTGLDTVDLAERQSLKALLREPWRPLVHEPLPETPSIDAAA
jgi:sterol desaturase/sphingolipid hydroxylase (fatty acid hydroxylase superfamily)